MGSTLARLLSIPVSRNEAISGLLMVPNGAKVCLVLAHGAGAGMTHPFMEGMAFGLYERGVATLRYQFPYMEQRRRRPDPPAVAQAAVRASVSEASALLPGVPLFAGGKSFGGRMTSQAQATTPLGGVRGLAFLGFPLHPAGKPSVARADHLRHVRIPMLFIQGSRDALADAALIGQVVADLEPRASLMMIADADHSFHVPVRSGRTDGQVQQQMLDALVRCFDGVRASADAIMPTRRPVSH